MRSTHYAVKLGALCLATVAVVACQGTPALEELSPGTEVTIEMQDGRRVTGKLMNVGPDTVVVSDDRNEGNISVTRSGIAEVQSRAVAATRPVLREVTAPVGSTFDALLDTAVASDTSTVEQSIQATLAAPLVADGVTIAPIGSTLLGAVTDARESGRVRGRAELGLRFHRLRTDAVTYDIHTAPMRWVAEATKGEDATKVGIGAAAGAVIGGIAGGGKGAVVGSAIGAGGGSAVVLATRGEEIRLGSGTRLRVELTEPLTVTMPADED